ncbi:MAG: aminoglycoside phosphotransferase family protein [Parvibaculaceae bacterium]
MSVAAFKPYLDRWSLTPDGVEIVTRGSRLLPVRHKGKPAMLKVAVEIDEKWGWLLMEWWRGDGAARAMARDGDALLLERATGGRSLERMAREGEDDTASRIMCKVAARLHAPRGSAPPDLIPLEQWFRDLWPAAERLGGVFASSAATARMLLAEPREVVVLHGDIHHGNILDFGKRGWLAIDPKRLIGERGFDFANIFTNPDRSVAATPGRLGRQVEVISEAARLEPTRLLQWIVAWTGLSATWHLQDGMEAESNVQIEIARIAAAELDP